MLKNLRILLLPLNLIYALVIILRNKFYDWGLFKSTSFDLPIICVGNLAVGGSGKTPTTEYLVRLLKDNKVAILSRGYGRKTSGFILADANATAETIGDEPLQYYRKFKEVAVAVCEDRLEGVRQLKDHCDLILLDDAYQHRAIKAGFNILLFEIAKLKSWQTLLPAGNLREPLFGTRRADAILITKADEDIKNSLRSSMAKKLNLKPEQSLSFSHIKYDCINHLYDGHKLEIDRRTIVFMLAGIANPAPFKSYLSSVFDDVIPFEYPDHHRFTETEIVNLVDAFESHPAKEKLIITTEKDGQRLLDNNLKDLLLNLPIYHLPIAIELNANDKAKFDQKILEYVARAKRFN